MVNAVTGRSFSTTVWAETGVTSMIQGDASSWRRNRVYAWISMVRPLIWNSRGGGGGLSESARESAPLGRAGLGAASVLGAAVAPRATSQGEGGSGFGVFS